jgi:inward rectifier potassium channel
MALRRSIRDQFNDLGFGNRVTEPSQRLINRDGSSNVHMRGIPFFQSLSIYHSLITMRWWKFNLIIFLTYLAANLVFTCLYYFGDIGHINGMMATTPFEEFMEAFFFSTQTLTTLGFGRLNPSGFYDSAVAAIESMTGLLGFALATGLLYGRFSRPMARLLFSRNAIVAPYRGIRGLMFRFGNARRSQLLELEVIVNLSWVETEDGKPVRRFASLELERNRVAILAMTWTVVHPIDENSPVAGWTPQDFEQKHCELIVIVKSFEETFSQTVYSRTSYKPDEIVHGVRFVPVIEAGSHGSVVVNMDLLSTYEAVSG